MGCSSRRLRGSLERVCGKEGDGGEKQLVFEIPGGPGCASRSGNPRRRRRRVMSGGGGGDVQHQQQQQQVGQRRQTEMVVRSTENYYIFGVGVYKKDKTSLTTSKAAKRTASH